ncbi:hypothetical protein [Paenibacillus spongiae]|uniref:Uncharacterized protein n=1 Tax=Paenibacillus spongiae TaxID=2909671 RepID=A0ABY5S7C7_9BACL|nr:hypothetical protein [Paenibacillus spongiae]UVI29408.1 hypothetical protein L1F29_28975 [Paenibacillus spongiae]
MNDLKPVFLRFQTTGLLGIGVSFYFAYRSVQCFFIRITGLARELRRMEERFLFFDVK